MINKKDYCIDNAVILATNRGMTSLIERSFGRGTDFICEDLEIDKLGGMLAVLTFFPLDKAEEV